jgi:SAM-dependent methyltransferase
MYPEPWWDHGGMSSDDVMDARATVAAGYDALGGGYAAWSATVTDVARDEHVAAFVARLPPAARVLDVGCGSGASWTGEAGDRISVTGIDISASQVEAARRAVPGGSFLVADVTEVEFDDAAFDAAVALYSIGHVPAAAQEGVFARLAQWLRPSGLLLASLPAVESAGWTGPWIGGVAMFFASLGTERYLEVLRAQGWAVVRAEERIVDEPEGGVPFLWVLATAPSDDRRVGG